VTPARSRPRWTLDIKLTMNFDTDPNLLDVRDALDVLPTATVTCSDSQGNGCSAGDQDGR